MRFTFMRKCTSSQKKVREGYNGTLRWWMETILRDHRVNHRQTIDQRGVKDFGFFPKKPKILFCCSSSPVFPICIVMDYTKTRKMDQLHEQRFSNLNRSKIIKCCQNNPESILSTWGSVA